MAKVKDITNEKFGKLTPIKVVGKTISGNVKWLCKCDCGNYKEVAQGNLKSGNVTSCGCIRKAKYPKRLFRIYHNIKGRCYNSNNPVYKNYGARGVNMCEEWLENYHNFAKWAVENGYSDELSIDRINNNAGYCPENCRWANSFVQNQNKRNCRNISYMGEVHCLSEWARKINQSREIIKYYLSKGFSFEQFLTLKGIKINV